MELRQLRYFIGVAEAGSLLRAAGRLHIAQPALGQQIAALEGELMVKLFKRSTRGMTLTNEGLVFLEHAKVVLMDVNRAKESVRHTSDEPQGEVVVGLPTTVALAATVPLLSACREKFPKVKLKVVEAYSGYLKEWLQTGRLDLAMLFGDEPDSDLVKRVLLEETLALVTPPDSKKLPQTIALKQLKNLNLILPAKGHGLRRIIDDACHSQGIALQVIAEIDSLTSVKKAVASGIGCTVLPMASVAEEVTQGILQAATIKDNSMKRRIVCATSVTRPTTVASAAVINLVTEIIREMVGAGSWPGRWIGDVRTGG